jgi:hypothetical protein
MPHYRIHRIKDNPQETFRWASHTGGLAIVKPRDYEVGESVEAANPYQTWKLMAEQGQPLRPGDVLELASGESEAAPAEQGMWIAKYVGFEPAQWFVPEPPKTDSADTAGEQAPSESPAQLPS